MSGWSKAKREAFEDSYREFLRNCYINSKHTGAGTCLGEHLYMAQERFIAWTMRALEDDIHKIFVLKSRQLGLSTITRALSIFYLGMHDGLQGTHVVDTDHNKQSARREIENMIDNLPKGLGFPRIKFRNRNMITLSNDSNLLFMSAGVKKSKGAGTLGRSVGLSFGHLSEICSFDNDEGMEALEQSFSDFNPDRLYIYESTARGPNIWKDLWEDARADTNHSRCLFLGWWSHPTQLIEKTDPDFERYGVQLPTDREVEKMRQVWERYDHKITPEQLAWVRRKMDPTAKVDGDAPQEWEGSSIRLQEQPWLEEDSWQVTGSVFFAPEDLTAQWDRHVSKNFKTYMFGAGLEWTEMKVYPAANTRSVEFRVWKEPEPEACYVLSADVAYGTDEYNDRSCIQVLRCFADGLDQEAEYAWPLIGSRQFAWVILAVAAWYAGDQSEVYMIIELNGPGMAVWDEINSVKSQLNSGYLRGQAIEKGLENVFSNIRNFVYMRPDSMSSGKAWQWKTSPGMGPSSKVRIMERLRDFVSNGMLHIRSLPTIEEMKAVTRDGDTIRAQGRAKDDRVVGLALGVRCWEDRVRKAMAAQRRTRDTEEAKRRLTLVDQTSLYNSNMLERFFQNKRRERARDSRILARSGWRNK